MFSAEIISYTAACGSAVVFALVVVWDTLMMRGCYDEHPSSPFIVSTIAGGVLGILCTSFLLFLAPFSMPSMQTCVLSLFGGMLTAVLMGLYFLALYSPSGDSAEVSAVIVAAPVFIVAAQWMLTLSTSLAFEQISSTQMLGVVLATISLLGVTLFTGRFVPITRQYVLLLVALAVCNLMFILVTDYALGRAALESPHGHISALTGFGYWYWFGVLLGGGALLFVRKHRTLFLQNLPRMRPYAWRILVLEILGMLVYGLEVSALNWGAPAVVSVITGTHIVLIFLVGIILRRLHLATEREFQRPRSMFAVVLSLLLLVYSLALVV